MVNIIVKQKRRGIPIECLPVYCYCDECGRHEKITRLASQSLMVHTHDIGNIHLIKFNTVKELREHIAKRSGLSKKKVWR